MGDLDCICKASNSLEHNTEFNQQCVLDACYGDIGREEFLDSLFYHCKKVDKELVDIPKRWEPYLPVTFPSAPDSTASDPKNAAPAPPGVKLNVQSIVGIVIGALLVLGIVFVLLWLWWKKKREAKKLRVENAQMLDAMNPDGFSNRIITLRGHSSIQDFADLRGTGSAGSDAAASRHGTASTYNDATLVGSPRSTTAFPLSPTTPKSPIPEYGTADEDCAMSTFVRYPGHKPYNDGQFELPNNQLRGSQVMQGQCNTQDDSASEYSARRPSYGDDSIDIRQDRESRAQFERMQRDEWERNGDLEPRHNRGDYVAIFSAACKDNTEDFLRLYDDEFTYEDLLKDTTPSSTAAITVTILSSTTDQRTSTNSDGDASSTVPTVSIATSTDTEQSAEASSQPPPSATSIPPSSTEKGETTSVGPAPLPNDTRLAQSTSKGQNGVTVHSHVTVTAISNGAPKSTTTAAAAPTLSTTAIAGTAAGGTVGIALIIGLIFLFMRRRKRQSSLASPADIWEPSRNTSPKPKLPNIQHDSSFGRYSEMGAGVPVTSDLRRCMVEAAKTRDTTNPLSDQTHIIMVAI
ncbi:hypothetical protein J4E86_000314 [Alternaria arbusti]|uniref:uncharacterized protein n=1 Tax=Alternaria arbusti TaxID=232088 RepID=UPI00221F1B9B|nr:uncharacterized protein J4E86_000314 [Alternaria arbusti]KAI4961287.1 hypothetical protein J4E86_000314 [Alternaria arbusti]